MCLFGIIGKGETILATFHCSKSEEEENSRAEATDFVNGQERRGERRRKGRGRKSGGGCGE